MKRTITLIESLVRPAFAILLGLTLELGIAQAGRNPGTLRHLFAYLAVAGWMLTTVALNDIADVDIDRINLPDDPRRALARGNASTQELTLVAAICGVVALGAGLALGFAAFAVIAGGLALSAAYSLPPIRLSARGVLTAAVLPLGYVAIPFIVGAASTGPVLHVRWALLAGLDLCFTGRLVLKDFRDLTGDRLYGKRTMLVRHGRRTTCGFCATFWIAGTVVAQSGLPADARTMAASAIGSLVVLALLADMVIDERGVRDTANVATIAYIARGLLVLTLAAMSRASRLVSGLTVDVLVVAVCAAMVVAVVTGRRRLIPAVTLDPLPGAAKAELRGVVAIPGAGTSPLSSR